MHFFLRTLSAYLAHLMVSSCTLGLESCIWWCPVWGHCLYPSCPPVLLGVAIMHLLSFGMDRVTTMIFKDGQLQESNFLCEI
jgi:hypothetical protein